MGVCNRVISIFLAAMTVVAAFGEPVAPSGQSRKNKARTEKQAVKNTKKRQNRKTGTKAVKKAPESKAELQRRQQATQAEIAETRRKIQENDRQVSRNLAELGKLQGDIETAKKQVAAMMFYMFLPV